MPQRAIIPAIISSANNSAESQRLYEPYPEDYDQQTPTLARMRYGATTTNSASNHSSPRASPKGKEPAVIIEEEGEDDDEDDDEYEEVVIQPILNVSWKYMSRLYLLVPLITTFWLACLILLITFAWPPDEHEKQRGQSYPHPFLWKPLIIGIFTSCTVQVLRVPTWVIISALPFPGSTILSTIIHTVIHELLRMSTLPLSVPSPTSGFHSSYYLGLGWGIAEATWGIIQGWEQLVLYEDVMMGSEDLEAGKYNSNESMVVEREGDALDTETLIRNEEIQEEMDEAELERKVEILERMRERRDLEEVLGVPFPSIPFALHLLWRLDTLLLNLGLTLILSAYYYDSGPIYTHTSTSHIQIGIKDAMEPRGPSPYLWTAWTLVTLLHLGVSLVWKIVGSVGIGAVTWGGLIVALGSVFAGLGCWGGLV